MITAQERQYVIYHYGYAVELALQYVEAEARLILRRHSSLDKFIMGNGSFFFTRKDGTILHLNSKNDPAYVENLKDFIGEWDQYLKLTGQAMYFTADGPKVTSW